MSLVGHYVLVQSSVEVPVIKRGHRKATYFASVATRQILPYMREHTGPQHV